MGNKIIKYFIIIYFFRRKVYEDMDLQEYERDLLNIRDRYSKNIKEQRAQNINNTASKDSNTFFMSLPYSYETPAKKNKNRRQQSNNQITFEKINKKIFEEPEKRPLTFRPTIENKCQFEVKAPTSSKIDKEGKEKEFNTVISEREKQLKECMLRNEKLLIKSKQLRNSQSKNTSATKSKENQDQELHNKLKVQNLKSLLTKEYAIKDKANISQRRASLFVKYLDNPQKDAKQLQNKKIHIEQQFGQAKYNFSQKMNNILKDNINNYEKPKEMVNHTKRQHPNDVKITKKDDRRDKQERNEYFTPRKAQQSRYSSIKTPIKPPKDYQEPIKLTSTFENTKSLHERIKVLLSK